MALNKPASMDNFQEKHSDGEHSIDKELTTDGPPSYSLANQAKSRKGLNGEGYKPMTPAERQIALKAALEVDPGVPSYSWVAFQMYLITLVICCCSGDSGFDGTVMGGINGMQQYLDYFGQKQVGKKTSIVFGIYTIGSIAGTIPASYLPDRIGRRGSMFFANTMIIIGACITANAKTQSMFLGGRFLTGLGSSCAGASAKSYLAEMAPAKSRGAYLGFLNSFFYVGQMTATGMMVATGRWASEMSWRLPLYVQVVPAAINVLCIFFCPESPRWLYSIGKSDQARKILAHYHSSTQDIHSPLIELEMGEIEEKIMINGADKTWWDFRPLFRTKADRYRAYMVILIGTFGQLSGNGMITYFLPVLLKDAGITSQNKVLVINFVNSVTSFIGALTGTFTVDRFGRRKILLIATIAITVILAVVSGLLSSFGNVARSNAGITFVLLFMVIFSYGWTPMQALYPAEVLSYEVRAKGLGFLGIISQLATLINTFGIPVALDKIKWKVYLIFLFWDIFEVIIIYFFVVETKGLTLEEINDVFESPNPRKYSQEVQIVSKKADHSHPESG
ncbi:general substrate transporter [Crepidotus variabilis]|uniref:General substrate transporter n=1 Tax=Crepidotus variabilis TaxID=179855 RepID=A0A9P6JUW9_9AGAR|nr:general substrate transporter [Crepidotus variabilis]